MCKFLEHNKAIFMDPIMSTTIDKTPFYQKLTYNLLSLSVLGVLFYLGQGILKPLFFAILLAVLLLPVVNFFRRKKFNKILSIIITLALTLTVILAITYFFSRQVFNFMNDFSSIQQRLDDLYNALQEWVKSVFGITIARQNEYIHSPGRQLDTSNMVAYTFVSLTALFSYMVFLPIYTFLILFYNEHIKKFLIVAFHSSDESKVREILSESLSVSLRYIIGLLIKTGIVFVLNAVGFLFLGIKYAFFLALLAALINLVPYIGMLVAIVICMLITFVFSADVSDIVWVGVILIVIHFIDANILMPFIVGSQVKINALITLLGVLIGGVVWGVSGMLLSIPGLAVLKVIFDRVDSLKPFGLLLGDETITKPSKFIKIKPDT